MSNNSSGAQDETPAKGLLGLVMIVKDEIARIGPMLEATLPWVDWVTILDTGSTDGTRDAVTKMVGPGKGELHEAPFVDFSTSRNLALDLHGEKTTFTLMVNVDHVSGLPALRKFLGARQDSHEETAYRVRLTPGHYFQTAILRSSCGMRYVGRTHEVVPWKGSVGPVVPGVSIHVDRGQRAPEQWRRRWVRDVDLLEQDIADRPTDPRPVFYLAQTMECLGGIEHRAQDPLISWYARAEEMYLRRAAMTGGYRDETYEAMYRIGRVRELLQKDPSDAYLAAHDFDPRRAEPLYALALRYHKKGMHSLSYLYARRAAELRLPGTDLFVDEDVYTWKSADLVGISGFYLRWADPTAFAVGKAHAERASLARPGDERLAKNLQFYDRAD